MANTTGFLQPGNLGTFGLREYRDFVLWWKFDNTKIMQVVANGTFGQHTFRLCNLERDHQANIVVAQHGRRLEVLEGDPQARQ